MVFHPWRRPTPRRTCRPTVEVLEEREVLADPSIVGSALSGPYLDVPANGPAFVSGVADDPTDPARTLGLVFTVADDETPVGDLVVTATSNNAAVVTNANLSTTGMGADRTLKITPNGVGYADITVTVTDGEARSASYVVQYAASAASANPALSRFHTGAADASTALALDNDYMIVADNEDQVLRLYNRNQSGLPVATFPITNAMLGITQADNDFDPPKVREVDIEASTKVVLPNGVTRIFWMGSLSNAANGNNNRPNRNRVFATDLTGAGAAATLMFVGHYDTLRQDLINWDVNNVHGLGADFFGLFASTQNGVSSEKADGSSFNVEGLTMAPGSTTTAYVAFRSPIVPAANRTRALIVPITNFPDLVNGTAPVFGKPIQLDLNTPGEFGPRGIRSIESNGTELLVVAGPPASAPGAINPFKLFTWDGLVDMNGNPVNAPKAQPVSLAGLNPEAIVAVPASPLTGASVVQLVSDYGDTDFYGDGRPAKELDQTMVGGKIVIVAGPSNWKKSSSDLIALGGLGGTVSFSAATFTVGEAGPMAAITLARTGSSAAAQTATIDVTGGSATAGADFTGGPYVVTFAAGATTATLNIPITNDTAVESNETVALSITNVSNLGAIGAQATTTLTITEDDQAPNNQPGPAAGPTGARPAGGGAVAAGPIVHITNQGGSTTSVAPFAGYNGSITTARGDVNADGILDTIVGAGVNAHVKVIDGRTGGEVRSFLAFPGYGGGVFVGAGDVNHDGFDDVIVGAFAQGHVKVFDGRTGATLHSFRAYGNYAGAVSVAGGDVDGDGFDDIITGAGVNGHVKVFSGASGAELRSFLAYGAFAGGVFVGAGDVTGDGFDDVITGAGAGAPGGHVKVFDGRSGAEVRSFLAFDSSFMGGARVASRLVNADGFADVVVSQGAGGTSRVRTFDGLTLQRLSDVVFSDPLNLGLFVG